MDTSSSQTETAFLKMFCMLMFIGCSALGIGVFTAGHRGYGTLILFTAVAALIPLLRPVKTRAPAPARIAEPFTAVPAGVLPDALIAVFPDPVILLDSRQFVRLFNPAAQKIFPLLKTGKPLSSAVRVPEILNALKQASRGQVARMDYAERVPQEMWMQIHAAPIPMHAENVAPEALLLTLKDLTPIRLAERMRVDFVANASHELRTPLASIIGFLETLQGAAKDDHAARTRFQSIMLEQAQRMARLVDDLLSLSHLEQKAPLAPDARTNLSAVVTHVADSLQPLAQQKGVTLTLVLPEHPITINGDRDELIRLVENLTQNAIKYGHSGKEVIIGLHPPLPPDVSHVRIAVTDFGPGIPAEHVPRLTERFYRVEENARDAHHGTGLGLALVKHILARHNGRMAIESQPGAGSTFTITLPALADTPESCASEHR